MSVLFSFDNLYVVYQWWEAPQLSIETFLTSLLSHMTKYIVIETDYWKLHIYKFG